MPKELPIHRMRLAFSQQNNKQPKPHHATCGFWWGWYKFPRWGKERIQEVRELDNNS